MRVLSMLIIIEGRNESLTRTMTLLLR